VHSLAAALLVAEVAFGAAFEVRGSGPPPDLSAGDPSGSFVAAAAAVAEGGGWRATLRPAALGRLAVPLPGNPEPAEVEVTATLRPGTAARAPVLPRPAPPLGAVALLALAAGGAAVLALRRRTPRSVPGVPLAAALARLAEPQAWRDTPDLDGAARAVRRFLADTLDARCDAMTTLELSRLLVVPGSTSTAAIVAVLEVFDQARFALRPPAPEAAAAAVRAALDGAGRLIGKPA
jgi:hypothetical protein